MKRMKCHRNLGFAEARVSYLFPLGLLLLSILSMIPGESFAAGENGLSSTQSDTPDVIQARRVFKQELERTPHARNVVFHTDPGQIRYIEYTDPAKKSNDVVQLTTLLLNSIVASYSPGNVITYPAWKVSYTEYVEMHQYFWLSSDWSQSDAETVVRALKVLVLDARQDLAKTFAANFEKFRQKCQSWRTQQENFPMPEEARRHKVLAENALREKNVDKAVDEYIEALQIYPCWPEGQFNAASMLGETGWYGGAVVRMKNYLELVPDAPDAQAARDKIAIWRDKMDR